MTRSLALLVIPWVAFAAQDPPEEDQGDFAEVAIVQEALEETLGQPEFARLRTNDGREPNPDESPEWLERFFRWLSDLLEGTEESSQHGSALPVPGRTPILVVVAVLLGVVVFFIARSLWLAVRQKSRADVEVAPTRVFLPDAPPGELAPEEYFRRALEHAESRHYRDAIRELLLGAMSATERRGQIRFRRGLTNRDYLYAVRGGVRHSFASVASAFEHVYFGRRQATSETFQECRREYQKSFLGASR